MKLAAAIMCLTRMEFPFIRDWLAYHHALGVDHFFIGMHVFRADAQRLVWAKKPFPEIFNLQCSEAECVDRFMAAIEPFASLCTVRRFMRDDDGGDPRTHRRDQMALYNDTLAEIKGRYDWMLVVDGDEYVIPRKHDSLKQALHEVRHRVWVGEWKMRQKRFASRWNERFEPIRVTENICCHGQVQDWSPKFVCRPSMVKRADIHYTETAWYARGAYLPGVEFAHFAIPANPEWRKQDNSKANTLDSEDRRIAELGRHLGVWGES